MNVVILAAGQGKRMHSDLPKVLHPLGGKPLLLHVLETAKSLGAVRICVVYGHGGESVRQALADENVIWAEQAEQLGTGHAVKQALPHLDERHSTLILYGDVPLISSTTLLELIKESNSGLGVLTVELEDPSGYGRIVRTEGRLEKIVEEKDASLEQRKIREINTGVLVAPTANLKRWIESLAPENAQREYYLTDIVAMAVAEGLKIHSSHPRHIWEILGVNSRAQLAQLESIRRDTLARQLLEQGVTIFDPLRIDVRGTLHCGRDCEIDINCVFDGEVTLGDRVRIGPNCILKNVRIGSDSNIEAYCHLDDAEVGQRCRIGPYSRLRPGTLLSEEVHIGNFVEIKASQIGAGTKASHLSYIGDSTVGRNVNIGAGTITCNYDGVNKHRTVIEDDVFIGSDTQLVAPVRVGRGATLGAGTTLTRDAPEDKLTLSRAKQITSEKWSRPKQKK